MRNTATRPGKLELELSQTFKLKLGAEVDLTAVRRIDENLIFRSLRAHREIRSGRVSYLFNRCVVRMSLRRGLNRVLADRHRGREARIISEALI